MVFLRFHGFLAQQRFRLNLRTEHRFDPGCLAKTLPSAIHGQGLAFRLPSTPWLPLHKVRALDVAALRIGDLLD
jgi:hypothetical protein